MQKAEGSKHGIVFVCDDRKDDWWEQFRGKTLGARPELVEEFKKVSDGDFHMYSSDRFLEFAGEHFNRQVSAGAVSEMRELKRADEERRHHMMIARRRRREVEEYERRIERSRHELMEELEKLENERRYLYHQRDKLSKGMDIEDPSVLKASEFEAMEQIIDRLRKLEHREIMLHDRLMESEK